ncbi:MAG: tRNA 2-thiouridine(34) synthase MnmA [Candidatus Omnitrophica bacterium]|nr:tRNA 2-thiouridine(34) synthase MnmA [Candidatus Omnitrophota bacterium]
MKKKVLVAMSGGVDSSVAAHLLCEENYAVVGVTMCLGIKEAGSAKPLCCGRQAIEDAKKVCHKLNISHYVMDFSKDLEEKVINPFIREYARGRTPNPCVECNKHIKFGSLLKKALGLDFDYLATGHYAKLQSENGRFFLKRPEDRNKDQSYFLYPIKYNRLKYILFPLDTLIKEEVRKIAKGVNLPVADKPQSQDICFIPDGDCRGFLKERIKRMNPALARKGGVNPGPIVDLNGKILGRHKGIYFYTVGQREGLGISSKRPLYVISLDVGKNQLIVGERKDLGAKELIVSNLNFLVKDFPKNVFAKIRYAHLEAKCKITDYHLRGDSGKIVVVFDEEQEAITPGQSIVFYDNDIVLGGGIIDRAGVSPKFPNKETPVNSKCKSQKAK